MCVFKRPKAPPPPPVVAPPPESPSKPPDPVEIVKDKRVRKQRRKNPLRIERDSGSGAPASGANI